MKAFVSTCLLLSVLPSVSSKTLTCLGSATNQEFFMGLNSCFADIKNKMCYSKVVDFPMEDESRNHTFYYKDACMSREQCHPDTYTASLPDGGYLYMKVMCCNKKLCNKPLSVPKQENRALNGMMCPGCGAHKTNESCLSEATVSCRGQENKCISYTGSLLSPLHYYPQVSFKGCATKNLCDLLTGATEEGKDLMEPLNVKEAECSPAEYKI